MTETLLKYLFHGEPLPEGWELAGSLEGTHHGKYASHIIKQVEQPVVQYLCVHCGQPLKEEQIHGSYRCVSCMTVTVSCCDGAA